MDDDQAHAAVLASEDERFKAMGANDIATLTRLLAADLHYVHANGVVEDKAEFLRKISSGERRYRRFETISRAARHEGGFTFVFGQALVEVDRAAGFLSNTLTYTAIYRDGAEPRFVAWHAVKAASE